MAEILYYGDLGFGKNATNSPFRDFIDDEGDVHPIESLPQDDLNAVIEDYGLLIRDGVETSPDDLPGSATRVVGHKVTSMAVRKPRHNRRPAIGEDSTYMNVDTSTSLQTPEDRERANFHGDIREQGIIDSLNERLEIARASGDSETASRLMIEKEQRLVRRIELGRKEIS